MTSERERPWSGQLAYPGGDAPLTNWRAFYGYKQDPYAGGALKYTAGSQAGEWVPVGEGFGAGDVRRGFKAGHTAHSIMKYLKGDDMIGNDGQFFQQGGTTIGQDALNSLRAQMSIEQGMKNMFNSYKGLANRTGTLETTQGTQQTAIDQNRQLASQVRINNPSTVTGGSALQIGGAAVTGGEGSSLGQLGAGIAGNKDDKKLTTTNLNV